MNTQSSLVRKEPRSLDQLRNLAASGQLYAILDACDTPAVPTKVQELGDGCSVSLYRGEAEEDYWAIAPYLVRVDGDLLTWTKTTLWKDPWGIFLTATSDLETLRRHFRKFLVVKAPDGRQLYFRYYDPRILCTYILTSSEEELGRFFGPVRAYGVSEPETSSISFYVPVTDEPRNAKSDDGGVLRIRQEQYAAFAAQAEAAFVNRVMQHLRQEHLSCVENVSNERLKNLVSNGLARARRYGLTWESSLSAFVALMFEYGPNFDAHPGVKSVLTDESVPPNLRLKDLERRTTDKDWEEVERLRDETAWGLDIRDATR